VEVEGSRKVIDQRFVYGREAVRQVQSQLPFTASCDKKTEQIVT
jgi:hypothetical protein